MTAAIKKLLEEINQRLTDIEKRLKDLEGLTYEEMKELMNDPAVDPNQ